MPLSRLVSPYRASEFPLLGRLRPEGFGSYNEVMRTYLRLKVRCHWCGESVTSAHRANTTESLMRVFVGKADSVESCPACDTSSTFSRKDYYVVQIPYSDEARRSGSPARAL